MRISDIDYVDGCTGEVLEKMTSAEMFEREVVLVEQNADRMIIYSVLEEDLPQYYAWEYAKMGEMSGKDFLANCSCCGGAWVSMMFTGLKKCFPKVYNAIPGDKNYSFSKIMELIELCGVVF